MKKLEIMRELLSFEVNLNSNSRGESKEGPDLLGTAPVTSISTDAANENQNQAKISPEKLQEIIRERNPERKLKTEEKRLEGLRRIAEMKSKSGVNPLAIFPKEIWAKIFNDSNLNPKDRLNLTQIHPLFHDLLTRTRDVLLPLVLDSNVPFLNNEFGHEHALKKNINLRRVSKSIRNAVDKWIENDLMDSMKSSSFRNPRFGSVRFELTDNARILKKISTFSETPKRFYPRSLEVKFASFYSDSSLPSPFSGRNEEERRNNQQRYLQNFNIFKDGITKLLETAGTQIWHFKLGFVFLTKMHKLGVSIVEVFEILQQWLNLMPNLKWLELEAAECGTNITPPNLVVPTLKKLERVDLTALSTMGEPTPLWDMILTSNPQVKYYVDGGLWDPNYEPYGRPTVLGLSLETVKLGSQDGYWDLALLRKISGSNWRLRKLELWMDAKNSTMNEVLQCIQDCCPLLEELSLHIDNATAGNSSEQNFLRLSKLKKLELEFGPTTLLSGGDFHFYMSLQFLVHCGNLACLTWSHVYDDTSIINKTMSDLKNGSYRKQNNGIVDFNNGFASLMGAGIWDVFPKMRSFKVNIRGVGYGGDSFVKEFRKGDMGYQEEVVSRAWKFSVFADWFTDPALLIFHNRESQGQDQQSIVMLTK